MEFNQLFKEIQTKFKNADASLIDGDLAIQITLTGTEEECGTFYVEAKNGTISIEPYEYYDRNVALTISSEDFIKMAGGKLDPVLAYTTGKLKAFGDLSKALELKKFIN